MPEVRHPIPMLFTSGPSVGGADRDIQKMLGAFAGAGAAKWRKQAPKYRAADIKARKHYPSANCSDPSIMFAMKPDQRLGQKKISPVIEFLRGY